MSEENPFDNVIQFPVIARPHPKEEADEKTIAESRRVFEMKQIQYDVDEIVGHMIKHLVNMGYPITEEKSARSITLVMEALTSMLYELHGFSHPLQQPIRTPQAFDPSALLEGFVIAPMSLPTANVEVNAPEED